MFEFGIVAAASAGAAVALFAAGIRLGLGMSEKKKPVCPEEEPETEGSLKGVSRMEQDLEWEKLLENVNNYDGTATGQKDVRECS